MSYFTQGKHFLQALAVCFKPFLPSLGGVLPNYLQALAVCFMERAGLGLEQFLDARREQAPRHTRHTLSTLNTILKLPSLKLVLVMWNPPISLVDPTCRPMQGHTS